MLYQNDVGEQGLPVSLGYYSRPRNKEYMERTIMSIARANA